MRQLYVDWRIVDKKRNIIKMLIIRDCWSLKHAHKNCLDLPQWL